MATPTRVPSVFVVIPTYNHARFLFEALRSLLAQTFRDWKAVVVNNFSDDETVKVVEDFKDDRIRLVYFRNHGIIGASRNEGIRHATADLVCFLDSDDTWYPTKLEKVVEIFIQRPDVGLVCHDEWLDMPGGRGRVLRHGPYTTYEDLLFKGNSLSCSAVTVRRAALSRVGGFSEEPSFVGSEDYDLWLRLVKAGTRIEYLHEVYGTYRVHPHSFMNENELCYKPHLNVLQFHFDQWPHKGPLAAYRLRKRRCAILRATAQAYLKRGAYGDAVRFVRRALGQDPLSWKAWTLGIVSLTRARTLSW